jgi:N-acyl-D-aspartate/D-glutamate deacylase
MAMHDLVTRGATVVEGLGHDPIRADIAVKDGRIAAIGTDALTRSTAIGRSIRSRPTTASN